MKFLSLRSMLFSALAFGAALHVLPVQAQRTEVLARVSGVDLTNVDLKNKEQGKLLQAEYQFYLTERKALEDLIDDQLVADAARKMNISTDDLLNKEIYKDVHDPTEDQLKVYYEGLDTKESYEAVRGDVLEHIRELRRAKAKEAFIAKLRKDANIDITLMPPTAEVEAAGAFNRGPKDAPVTLVEFADYECPYCQKVNPQLLKLKKEYGDKLNIVYKDFPLPMHHSAEKAAEAARCAGEQDKFWEYHDVLFYSHLLSVTDLKDHARTLKLDGDKFDTCLDSGKEAEAVKKDLEQAKSLGLTGTPSFFVNGHFFSGVVDPGVIRDMVDQQLEAVTKPNPSGQIARK